MSTRTIIKLGGKMATVLRESVLLWDDGKMTIKIWREEPNLTDEDSLNELRATLHALQSKTNPRASLLEMATHILSIDRVRRVEMIERFHKRESHGVSLYRDWP